MEHPVLGVCSHRTQPYKLSRTEARIRRAPCLGEHNDHVCTAMLGMTDEEFIELLQEGVFH